MESRIEIENAFERKAGMCKTRLDAKIHPLRKLRMQSSRTDGDSSSTRSSMQESGQPEDAKTTPPEKLKIRGNPEIHSPAPLRDARFEATRKVIH
jgi:hypothetical protein